MISAGLVDKAEILKKPVGGVPMGGMPMPGMGIGQVHLKKVEKTPDNSNENKLGMAGVTLKPVNTTNTTTTSANSEKNQNLAHLSNIMVQGAIRKSLQKIFFLYFYNIF